MQTDWQAGGRRLLKTLVWPALAGLVLGVQALSAPGQIDSWYGRGLFPLVRQVQAWISAVLPGPVLYWLVAALTVWLLVRLIRWWRSTGKWIRVFTGLISFLGFAVFWFQFLWGLNYKRPTLERKIGLEPVDLQAEELELVFQEATFRLEKLRSDLALPDSAVFFPGPAPDDLLFNLRQQLDEFGFPADFDVRVHAIHPKGILLHFSSSGVYLPWTGEGQIDAGLHPLQVPFVEAHEMAHGFGITDEGSCNFLAYLTCMRSGNPGIRYAGYLTYWRYLATAYRRYCPETYRVWRADLSPGILADLEAVNQTLLKYPDWMPRFREMAYDSYLKAQGIREGVLSYDRIVGLVYAWDRRRPETKK